MAVTAIKSKNAVESLRDIVQDLLVPELKAIKTELDSQRRENQVQFAAIRTELNVKTDALSKELTIKTESLSKDLITKTDALSKDLITRTDAISTQLKINVEALRADTEALRVEMRIRDEKQSQALQALADKMGTLIEVRERLAVLEDRAKHA